MLMSLRILLSHWLNIYKPLFGGVPTRFIIDADEHPAPSKPIIPGS